MKNSNLMMALFAAAGLCLAGGAGAQAMNKDARDMSVSKAESQYKMDKEKCAPLSDNAKDVCMEEAKGREKVAKAEAHAAYENTPKARTKARTAKADADYEVAKEKCDDLAGNAKDVCVKEAKAMRIKATADAKVDRVAMDTRQSAAKKTAEAKREATVDKRDADYKVAIEKCDSLAGNVKDACVRDAKTRYGKT